MRITQRQSTIGLFLLQLIGAIIGLLYFTFAADDPGALIGLAIGTPILIVLLAAYALWGWEPARYLNLILIAVLVVTLMVNPARDGTIATVIFLPVALAVVFGGPLWVAGIGLGVLAGVVVRGGLDSPYSRPDQVLGYVLAVGALIVGRLIADQARRDAEAGARLSSEAMGRAEQQARETAVANAALQEQLLQQRELADLVATLETPSVPLVEGVLLAPIIGHLTKERAASLTAKLLRTASEQHARLVILDTAGLADVDTGTAGALAHTAQALRLLGCEVAISGISAEVAMTLTELNVEMTGTRTVRSPQEALRTFLERGTLRASPQGGNGNGAR